MTRQPSPPSRRPQSIQTREALVAAARTVFTETSFHDTKIGDIAARAGVSHGTFYTHFTSKLEIFVAVIDEVTSEGFMETGARRDHGVSPTPEQQIEAANHRYMRHYAENARIMASMDVLAPLHPEVEERREQSAMAYTYRTAAALRRWAGARGLPEDADPETLAFVLCAMVERLAQYLFVFRQTSPDEDEVLRAVTTLCAAVLGLDDRAP